jgi:hypothetical protein
LPARLTPERSQVRALPRPPLRPAVMQFDVRTVASRIGHSGGGVTTPRVYAAWLAEADQRASAGLAARMPVRPAASSTPAEHALTRLATPREHLAAVVWRDRIVHGEFAAGAVLPGIKQHRHRLMARPVGSAVRDRRRDRQRQHRVRSGVGPAACAGPTHVLTVARGLPGQTVATCLGLAQPAPQRAVVDLVRHRPRTNCGAAGRRVAPWTSTARVPRLREARRS